MALISAQVDMAIKMLAEVKKAQDAAEERLRTVEQDLARLKERMGLIAMVLTGASVLFAAAAAWLGRSF
jgi:hypothetical protein